MRFLLYLKSKIHIFKEGAVRIQRQTGGCDGLKFGAGRAQPSTAATGPHAAMPAPFQSGTPWVGHYQEEAGRILKIETSSNFG